MSQSVADSGGVGSSNLNENPLIAGKFLLLLPLFTFFACLNPNLTEEKLSTHRLLVFVYLASVKQLSADLLFSMLTLTLLFHLN